MLKCSNGGGDRNTNKNRGHHPNFRVKTSDDYVHMYTDAVFNAHVENSAFRFIMIHNGSLVGAGSFKG